MPRWQTKKTGHRSSLFRVDFWIEQLIGMRARFAMSAHITGSPSVGEHQFDYRTALDQRFDTTDLLAEPDYFRCACYSAALPGLGDQTGSFRQIGTYRTLQVQGEFGPEIRERSAGLSSLV